MTTALALSALWLGLAAAGVTTSSTQRVDGVVHDVSVVEAKGGPEVWVSVTDGGKRKLYPLGGTLKRGAVPKGAVFAAICPDDKGRYRPVFADDKGLVDRTGTRVLNAGAEGAVALAQTPDPERLHFAPLCASVDGEVEYRFFTNDGLLVKRGDKVVRLAYRHRARSYAGAQHRGIHSELGYAAATSVYLPHLYDEDVDGDGVRDLVMRHQRTVVAYRRDPLLSPRPVAEVDVASLVGATSETSMNVLVGDVDGDGRADLVTGLAPGLLAEESSAWALLSSEKGAFMHPRRLWLSTGLKLPIALAVAQKGRAIITAEVDTSLVSLGRALVASAIDVDVGLADAQGAKIAGGPRLSADIDVRRGEMSGALPLIAVDFNRDGREDLLDIARRGEARVHLGTADGFEASASSIHAVPELAYARGFRDVKTVVLVSTAAAPPSTRRKSSGLSTDVTLIVAAPERAASRSRLSR